MFPSMPFLAVRLRATAMVLIVSAGLSAAARGQTTTYNGTDGGTWSTAADWSAGVPTTGQTAALPALLSSYTLNFDVSYPTIPPNGFTTLTIDGGSFQIGLFHQLTTSALSQSQSNTSMSCGEELIGDTGPGFAVYSQSAGTNTTSNFVLGFGAGSNGIYNLSSNASLTGASTDSFVGYSGNGTFNQSGTSAFTVANLTVGAQAGSSGSYTLSGGTLTLGAANSQLTIGSGSSGMFAQSAGTVTTRALWLGTGPTGNGTYKLGGSGSLTVMLNGQEVIGSAGHAEFDQTGGTNTVNGPIRLVINGGQGIYNLQGGTVSAQSIQINPGGMLNQTGGTITASTPVQLSGGTITGTLQNLGTFHYSSGTFSGRLVNQGQVIFDTDFTAGNGIENDTLLVFPSGLTITLGGSGLDNRGTLTLAGGTLVLSTAAAAANTNSGTFNLNSGQAFHLSAASLTNAGVLNLNGSLLDGTGTLNNAAGGTIAGYGIISSPLNNSGGTLLVQGGALRVTSAFTNSGAIQLAGGTLGGGDVTNAGAIRGAGAVNSSVTNTGTIEPVSGTLLFNGPLDNNSGGTIYAATGNQIVFAPGLASNAGTINLSGGIFDNNNHPLNNIGTLIGFGTLRTGGLTNDGNITLSGGSTSVAGDVINSASHTLTVEYTPAIFTGNVTNNGTIKITKTTVTFAGTFTNNGTYNSDPSDNYFADLTVGPGGYLLGGPGDRFFVSGNFTNSSAQSGSWNTSAALLDFQGGGAHQMSVAGGAGKFGWGNLVVEAGNRLSIAANSATAAATSNGGTLSQAGGASSLGALSGSGSTSVGNPAGGAAASMALTSLAQNSLAINSTGTVTLAHNSPRVANTLNTLSIAAGGRLDLSNNDLRINYSGGPSPAGTIRSYLAGGYNGGSWNGPGIDTSAADPHHALGYADGASGVVQGLSSAAVLVMYTIPGDLNLDGAVNFADLLDLAQHYGRGNASWDTGDVNYDGSVNFADLLTLAQNYGQTLGAAATAALAPDFPAGVSVPEPTWSVGLSLIAVLPRRRNRR